MDFSDISKQVGRFAQRNAPAILTAVAVVGTVSTAYLTGRASFRAAEIILDREYEHGIADDPREQMKDRVKLTWKLYIPPVTSAAVTIAAIIAAQRVSSRRIASVATALAIGEKAFSEYKDKVVEKFGEGKERGVRDDIAQDHVRENPPTKQTVIVTNNGHVLCRDEYSGRYFESSVQAITKAQNDLNKKIIAEGDVSLSDFYDCLGLPRTSHSDDVGWNTDEFVEIIFSTAVSDDEKPCICFTFEVPPFPAFYKSSR